MTISPLPQPPQPAQPASQAPVVKRAQAYQISLRHIRSLVRVLLKGLWHTLNLDDLPGSMPAYVNAVHRLVTEWSHVAVVVAREHYDQERRQAGVSGHYGYAAPPTPTLEEVESVVKWATRGLWSAEPDVTGAQSALDGAVPHMVTQASHQTIIDAVAHDPRALAWARVAGDDHPCAFCSMLISRGPRYRSERAADFRAHDHCECLAVPAFTHADLAELSNQELQDAWQRVTASHSGKAAIKAWREWWDHGGAVEMAKYVV